MPEQVKTSRRYDNSRREAQAQRTRQAVLAAARELIVSQGYARTTVAMVARRAGVNLDTVYAAVGRKPEIMTQLVETAISGEDHAVPAEERDYVQRLRAAEQVEDKLGIYADAVSAIQGRLAPVFLALRDAAQTDEHCRTLWAGIAARRAENMLLLAHDLRATGRLRPDLTDQQVADVIWSMNAAEHWDLLVGQRGWTPEQFRRYLVDAWSRLLLA